MLNAVLIRDALTPLGQVRGATTGVTTKSLDRHIPSLPRDARINSLSVSLGAVLAHVRRDFRTRRRAARGVGQFISSTDRRLHAPLTTVRKCTRLCGVRHSVPKTLRETSRSVRRVRTSDTHVAILIRSLLSLTHLSRKHNVSVARRIGLASIIHSTTSSLRTLSPSHNVSYKRIILRPNASVSRPTRFTFRGNRVPRVRLGNSTSELHRIIAGVINGVRQCAPTSSPIRVSVNILPTSVDPRSLSHVPSGRRSLHRLIRTVRIKRSVRINVGCTVIQFDSRNPNIPPRTQSGVFRHFCATSPSHTHRGNNAKLNVTVTRSIIGTRRKFVYTSNDRKAKLALAIILPVTPIRPGPRPVATDRGQGGRGGGHGSGGWHSFPSKGRALSTQGSKYNPPLTLGYVFNLGVNR